MRRLVVAALAGLLASCAGVPGPSSSDARFTAITEKEWAWRNSLDPKDDETEDTSPASWRRVDPETQARRLAYMEDVMRQLDGIDPAPMSPEGRINLGIYRDQILVRINQIRFREYEKPLNADTTFWTTVASAAPRAFRSEAQARAWVSRLNDVPRHLAEQTANMRLGLARGFTPPKVTLQGRDASISAVYEGKTAEQSPFFKPFLEPAVGIAPDTWAQLKADAKTAIETKVFPAYRELYVYFREEYLPKAREELAATTLPDGKAYYQSLIKEFTTVDMTPEEIHQIGLSEVARIKARMMDVMKQTGFKGDLPAFLTYLRTDPQFYPKTAEELLMRGAWIAKKFDGRASRYFGRLPRSRFAIVPVPDDIAPFYTAARGGSGTYLLNTYNLPSRSLYSLPALTLHESAPGHAFQMPMASEQEGIPEWRRSNYISAYGEGWALYCELLGEEMGMYETPYEVFGMLSYQMWRASRLVVDTGVHAKGWTREQSLAFLRDNTALAEHEITTEVDRYISWPGQALSYYLGEMAIVKARKKAEAALGSKFQVRWFHDVVLQLGSVPLPVLEARVDRWIAEGGPDPYAGK